MVKPLTVYKASAGSGKTFTLAVEYIKLLVKNPLSYRNILAVTFTNKATEEMKMRILSQLYGIWKQLPDSNDYAEKVIVPAKLSTYCCTTTITSVLRPSTRSFRVYYETWHVSSTLQPIFASV